jgi:hypothetical protein
MQVLSFMLYGVGFVTRGQGLYIVDFGYDDDAVSAGSSAVDISVLRSHV